MIYAFAGLAVVLWRLAVSGRARWAIKADRLGAECLQWGRKHRQMCEIADNQRAEIKRLKTENAGLGDGRVWYERDRARELLAQTEVQLIDARRARDEAWRERDRVIADTAIAIRGMMADLGQANERTRDLQERLTAAEARADLHRAGDRCADCACSCEGTCARCHSRPLAPAPGWDANGSPVPVDPGNPV